MRTHWERFLPTLVQELNAQSPEALDKAIRKASWEHEFQVLLHLSRAPELHRRQVEELYRETLYPLPESSNS